MLIQGHVEAAAAGNQERWDPATMFQSLFVSDRVRTLTASRSAILFIDETQVKLNAGAVLTVQQIKTGSGTSTTLGLLEGEGWFRTKNPGSGLTIKTPRAAAAIRGTEINIVVRGQDAVLTVTEGSAEFSNDAGSILVNAGEEATATPGQPPSKRVVLNPEDAVQWVLYYPTRVAWHDLPASAQGAPARAGFDRLKAGDAAGAMAAFQPTVASDPWSRIGAAMALEQLGDAAQARTLLTGATATGEAEVERRAELAAAALAIGDARAARNEVDAALAIEPAALRPLVILSELELTQNRKDEAAAAARRAVAAHPESVAAHVAAAEVAQAAFDLDTARRELDRALAIDPADLRALVDRARIRFGVGDTAGAQQDIGRAFVIGPADAQVRSLRGFINLANDARAGARADFAAAVASDQAFGEPHLGLGLLDFRDGQTGDGLLEMLTATLLEPKVSLYQSYLGKAYYQLKRFPEGLAALASAKRLDPRDPTPWLYTSLFLRDQNRQVLALGELRHAIALNDNRAVYRSRLLLDRDLATKNVSLAQLYDQLGFDAWGAYEALNSLNADLTNASAHLFLANTYVNLPDRTQATSSELLQYFLYAPVNLNSFNNFSEYTGLLEQPLKQALVTPGEGNLNYGTGTFSTRSGNQRFAHASFIDFHSRDGARRDGPDQRGQAFAEAKVALSPSSDLFFSVTGVTQVTGQTNDVTQQIGTFPDTVILRKILVTPDPTITSRGDVVEAQAGFKHGWKPGTAFTAASLFDYQSDADEKPDSAVSVCDGFTFRQGLTSSSRLTFRFHDYSVQAQQATRFGRHQLLFGADAFRRRNTSGCEEAVTDATGQLFGHLGTLAHSTDQAASAYVRDEIELTRRVHATVGARYEKGRVGDLTGFPDFTFGRWNPYAGLSVRLSPTTVVHVAGLRNTNADFLGSKISPPTVAGFTLERNELATTERDEGDVAVQNAWGRSFLEARGFVRHSVAPAFLRVPPGLEQFASHFAGELPDANFHEGGFSSFFNQILVRQLSLFADEQFVHRRAVRFDRDDNQVRMGLNYIHERGLFVRASARFLHQAFSRATITGLSDSSFVIADTEVKYEFAGKRGLATWTITNLFDRQFQTIIEGLSVDQPVPQRRMTITVRWRL